jgi:hypothetical protein
VTIATVGPDLGQHLLVRVIGDKRPVHSTTSELIAQALPARLNDFDSYHDCGFSILRTLTVSPCVLFSWSLYPSGSPPYPPHFERLTFSVMSQAVEEHVYYDS